MAILLSPQVFVTEKSPSIPVAEGVDVNRGALVGIAEKGPINVPTAITSLTEFVQKFGGPISAGLLYWQVKGFYANAGEGSILYIVRVAHYTDITDKATLTAVKANKTFQDQHGTPVNTLKVSASSEGTWGNSLQVTIENASRFATTINQSGGLANSSTSIELASVEGIRKGTVLHFDDTSDSITLVVDKVENKRVFFVTAPSGLSDPVDDGATVTEVSFNLKVYLSDVLVDEFPYVSMQDTNEVDFVEKRVNGKQENYIEVEDLDSGSGPGLDRPAAVTKSFLASGGDGLSSLNDGDLVGNAASGTGLRALDSVKILNMHAIAESQSSTAQLGVIDYARTRRYSVGILSSPLGLTEQQANTYINTTLAANTSQAVFYYKQVNTYNPSTNQPKLIPNEGHCMGLWVDVAKKYGIQQAPAGDVAQFADVLSFENDYAQDVGKRDLIYPNNINPLVQDDELGRVIFGSRTLLKSDGIGKQINERRIFNYIGQTIELKWKWVLFKNAGTSLKTVKSSLEAWLLLQKQDGLIEDFFVDMGPGVNNALTAAAGKLKARVGVRAPKTIEFFEVDLERDQRAEQAVLEAAIG